MTKILDPQENSAAPADGANMALRGAAAEAAVSLSEPDAAEIRRMLRDLQVRQGWSQATLATMLGVPPITARRWLSGARRPSGAAKKLIWLTCMFFSNPGRIRTAEDFAGWKRLRDPQLRTESPCQSATRFQVDPQVLSELAGIALAKASRPGASLRNIVDTLEAVASIQKAALASERSVSKRARCHQLVQRPAPSHGLLPPPMEPPEIDGDEQKGAATEG